LSFRLVGTDLLRRWYETETDPARRVRMSEWLADLLDAPWPASHEAIGSNPLLRVAIVPGTGWAVQFLINDGERQVELKSFSAMG
jgi:hypothetical protein